MLLTFINFVANFRTLFTTLSSSFLWGFFSILRYTFICNHKKFEICSQRSENCSKLRVSYLLCEQHRGVAVLAVGLGA